MYLTYVLILYHNGSENNYESPFSYVWLVERLSAKLKGLSLSLSLSEILTIFSDFLSTSHIFPIYENVFANFLTFSTFI